MHLPQWTRELYVALWASFLIVWILTSIWLPELRERKESVSALLLILMVMVWAYVRRA